jgi:hypothetical protein
MVESHENDDNALWRRLVEASQASAFDALCCEFLGGARAPVEAVRRGLGGSVRDVLTALGVAMRASELDRIELFPSILRLCAVQKFARLARAVVLRMSRPWVLDHIEPAVGNLLEDGDRLDYSLLLMLLTELDPTLAVRLARKAAAHTDYDVREVGQDFLTSRGLLGRGPQA